MNGSLFLLLDFLLALEKDYACQNAAFLFTVESEREQNPSLPFRRGLGLLCPRRLFFLILFTASLGSQRLQSCSLIRHVEERGRKKKKRGRGLMQKIVWMPIQMRALAVSNACIPKSGSLSLCPPLQVTIIWQWWSTLLLKRDDGSISNQQLHNQQSILLVDTLSPVYYRVYCTDKHRGI